MEKYLKKDMCVCVCVCVRFRYLNLFAVPLKLVNQLYVNLKKKRSLGFSSVSCSCVQLL